MSGAETRKERKVVTCLFADLVGFTARAESLDPEDVEAILRPYHERLRSELERFGGTVEKFIGDAVMALFGAPIAHEDDPERAVRAALAIRDWARDEGELEVRIGITTGEALVVLGARPEAGEGMASGDVVNTASRLQSAAPANGALVDETTYRATERAIEYRDAEAVEAKGKAEPVPVWEPLEPRARFGTEVAAPQTPLVGREHERELLASTLDRAKNERSVQLVTLVGVPGIGKSRLVAELFQLITESPELVTWRQGRSLPYGDGVTYWALGEMVKNQAGILETDTAEQVAEKLQAEVARLFGDEEARAMESRLGLLLGLETTDAQPEDKRAEAFYAWRRFLEELADERPTVLVFEDLHWADDDLLDFVDHLVDWAADVPLLCVCTARPELLERRPTWGGGKPNASTISLSPLSDEETARLLAALLERTLLPAEQQAALLARAGGNPLYAEQFAHMLSERGDAEDLPLPETVQGIIAARLDGLDPEEKALLQDAAVVGKVFWAGAAATMDGRDRAEVEQRLHALARKDFVRRQRRPSVEGESEYAFLHLLVRDVAYGQIPRAARSEKHQAVAEWMSALGRAEEHSEVVAHHYLQALEYAQAAGRMDPALAEPARHSLRSAGDRAQALGAFSAALHFYESALALWPPEEAERGHVLLGVGRARVMADHAGLDELEEARDALLAHGDHETAAEAEALTAGLMESAEMSRARLEHALQLVRDRPPSQSKALVLGRLAYRTASVGDSVWERYAEEALAIAEGLGLEEMRAYVLMTIGTARGVAGDPRGVAALEQAIEITDALDSPESIQARINLGAFWQDRGELRRCFPVQARARRDAERFGIRDWSLHLQAELVWECYWCGRWDEMGRVADSLLAEIESGAPEPVSETACRFLRAHLRLASDDVEGAIADSAQAVERARRMPVWDYFSSALLGHARVLLAAGRNDEADQLLTEAVKLGVSRVPYVGLDLALALVDLGRADELPGIVTRSSIWFDAAKAFAAGDYLGAADLYAQIGSRPDEADARLRSGIESEIVRALEFYRSVGATRYMREAEAQLAASA